jgi:outer membrane protein
MKTKQAIRPLLGLLLLATGSTGFAENLLQIYRDAQTYDATFAGAKASYLAAQEKPAQGLAGLLPVINFSAGANRNSSTTDLRNTNTSIATGSYNSTSFGISLTQPLFRWQNWQQYEQGKLQGIVGEAQYNQAKQDFILRIAQAYFDVLAAQDTLTSVEAQKKAITEQLAQAKRNFEVGTATITDTHEAQARYDLTQAQALAADNDVQVKKTALMQLIGKQPKVLAGLKDKVQLTAPEPQDINKWVGQAEQDNYTVLVQEASLSIAKAEVERNRAGHFPTLDLVSSLNKSGSNYSSTNPTGSDTRSNVIGLQLNLPIFAGGAVNSKVNETIALQEKAKQDLEATRRSIAQSTRQAYFGVQSGLSQVKAYEQALISSQSALDANKLGYQVGIRINIDVLNAQQQLYSTQSTLSKARYDTIMNSLKLKAAAGILKDEDIEQVNGLLSL